MLTEGDSLSSSARAKASRIAMLKQRVADQKHERSLVTVKVVKRPGFRERLADKLYRPDEVFYPSFVSTGAINVSKAAKKVYTGTVVLGIATMHKSNAVPVISKQEAQEIARMSH